jgi:hypothetical protein
MNLRFLGIVFFLIVPFSIRAQCDTLPKSDEDYVLKKHYPFFQTCKNCKSKKNKPCLLCGHGYRKYFVGYSYDKSHWATLGFAIDRASCYPEKGSYYWGISYSFVTNRDFVNSISLTYLRDHQFRMQFIFLKYGANLEYLTDFNQSAFKFRPEIRICDNMDDNGFFSRFNFAYGYNFFFSDRLNTFQNRHQFTIIFNLKTLGWIS